MLINDVHKGIEKRKARKRVGRGMGSGLGKTSGKGDKGHSSRQGFSRRLGHEGGQMSLVRRVAKFGFSNEFHTTKFFPLNVYVLERTFENGETVSPETLREKGLVKGKWDGIKILGTGNLTKKLIVVAHEFSASAEQKILASGGTATRVAK
jgi:large subunit ribosomal protein L15